MKLPETFRLARNLDEKTAQLLEKSYTPSEDPFVSDNLELLVEEYQRGHFNEGLFDTMLWNYGYRDSIKDTYSDYHIHAEDSLAEILIKNIESSEILPVEKVYLETEFVIRQSSKILNEKILHAV